MRAPSHETSLAEKCTVLIVDRNRHLVSPAILVVVAAEPELIGTTSHVVDQDVPSALVATAIAPADGVLRFSEDFIGAGVDVA